ncbi:MAG: nuclear transport factor 2 family protein [Chloroflexi bacterium]|nr:nuclear transport factor 2 family protein [Chloroflexota bacterium]
MCCTTRKGSAFAHRKFHIVGAFNDALNARDVDGMMRRMTGDCVFEHTYPAPDGTRYVGQSAVRAFWENFFAWSRNARIEIEEIFAANNRGVMRWTYRWTDSSGVEGHVRGVAVYRIENGLIAKKFSYVKG